MKRILFFFAAIILLSTTAFSQGSNCASATPFCGDVTFPNNTATVSQSGPSYGCLGTQPNPAWFIIKSTGPGTMVFNISQQTGGGSAIDVDFIAWGPFASTTNICNSLTGSCSGDHACSGNIEDCSYNPAAVETMTLVSTAAGQYFMILITNYADVAGNITFDQTSGPATDCSITCPTVTAGNGYLLAGGGNMPATIACSAAPIGLIASNNTPFGNPITPGIMISFTSNTNNTLQINWYENAAFVLCAGPGGCALPIPINTNNDIQFSTMSPSATNQIQLCESSNADADIAYTIVDCASGATLSSGTWATDGACLNINYAPGTISGVSSWTISPACPGCLSTTDWGYAQFNPGVAPAGAYNICYSFDPPGTCPTYTYCQSITVTNPNNPNWTGPAAMCSNAASINLNTLITGTAGGTWSGTGVTGSTFNPASGTSNVTYTVGSGTCSATQMHTITVTPAPTTANAGPDQTVCATTATLAGNVAAVGTGTWTVTAGGATVTTPGSPTSGVTGLTVGANTFVWTISNPGCTPSTDAITITRTAAPTTANAGPDQTVCATSATLAGNTAAVGTGIWTLTGGSGTITTPTSPTTTVTSLGVGANTFTWTITNAPCPATLDAVVITRVAAPTTAAAGPDQAVCGTTATLAGNGVVTGTGAWSVTAGTATVTTPSSPTSGVTGLSPGLNTFTWTISNAPCTPSTDAVNITSSVAPTVANAGPDQAVCATTATLAGNTAAVGTGSWTVTAGPATVTTPSSPTSGVTGLGVGTNTFVWTITNAPCSPTTDAITITRTAAPTTSAAGPDQSVCGTTATLAANTAAVGTGAWTVTAGTATVTTPSSPTSGVTGLSPGLNTFVWTISNAPCTPSTDAISITSAVTPTVANAGPDQTVCATTATLAGNTAAVGTGSWTVTAGPATVTTPSSPTSGVTGLGVGTNTFVWTITNAPCSPTTDAITITRTAAPTTAAAGPDQTTCATTATLAGNVAATGTGVWTVTAGSSTVTTPSSPTSGVTGLSVGVNTYTWTITNAPCAPSTDQITINHPAPDVAAFTYSSSTYCQTGTDPAASITGTLGGTFTSSPAGLVFLNTTTGLIDVSASALNTYTVTYTTSGACPATSFVNITITSAPAATFSYAGPYCQNGANPLPTFSGGGSAGTFTSTPGLVFVNVNTGQINLTASTPGPYTVTNTIAASGGCVAATATASVTINPAPVVTATPASQTICSGTATNIALTSSVGSTTYSWTVVQAGVSGGSSGTGTPIAQTLSTTAAAPGTATYTINSLSGGCAGSPINVVITVNPLPTVTPSPATQTICSGSPTSISLSGSLAGTTFSWIAPTQTGASGGAAGSGASITQTLTATGAVAGTVTYTVVPTANSCPGTSSTVTITVNPTPVVTASPMASSICSGATTAITLSSTTPGTTFTWVASNGAGISGAASGTGTSITQALTNATGSPGNATYTITPSANGCPGSPIVVTVTVNPVPTAAATPSSQTICSGSTTGIALTGSIVGTTFAWGAPTQTAASGGAAGSGSTIAQVLLATGAGPGTVVYSVTPTSGTCSGTPIPVSITVNPVPFVTATPLTSTICSGATSAVSLTSFTTGTTFSWTAANGTNIAGATSGSGTTIAQVLANSGTTVSAATFTVTPTASGCPGSPVTVTVNVNPVPNVIASPLSQTICSGSTSSISLSSAVTGTTFTWTAPTQTGASGGTSGSGSAIAQVLNATGATSGTVVYSVTPTANGCPGTPISITITVEPNPVATATPSSAAICSGTATSIVLSSTISGTTYTWTTPTQTGASGGTSGSGSTITQTLTATGTTAGTVTYNVIATTAAGCTATIPPIVITVNPSPDITATPTNATICSGATTGIVMTSSVSGATFTWTVVQSGVTGATAGSGSSISQVLSTTGATPGTAVYTITPSASGCASGSPATVTITVNPLPTATATPSSQSICDGSATSINLTSNLGTTTFDWTVVQTGVTGAAAGTGSSISQLLNLNTATVGGTVDYTITPTDNGCPGTPITVTVTVNPIDDPTFSYSSSTYCQTGTDPSAAITGTAGGVFHYAPAGLVIDSITGLIDLSATAIGTYAISYQTNGVCPNNSFIVLTVTNAPNATFSYTASVCSSDPNPTPTFGLGASAGIFTSSPSGLVFVDSTTGEINLTLSTAGTYTLTNSIAPGGGCAAASATGTITISQAATVDAGLNDTICEQGILNLSGLMGGSASSILWTTGGTGTFGDTLNPVTTYTPSAADIAAGIVVLTITTDDPAGGCASVNDFAVLYITPLDSADFSYSGSTFCASGTNPIPTVTGMPGGMFTSSPAGLVFVNALTGEISLSGSVLGTYDVVYSTNGPCPSADTVSITITNAPSATFTFTAATTAFCQTSPNPTPVFGSGSSAGVFTVSPSGLVFVSATTGEIDLGNSAPGTYVLTNTIVAAGGCASAVDSLTITINQAATATAGNDTAICAGSVITVNGAIGGSATSLTWTTNGSGTFGNDTIGSTTYTPSVADTTSGSVTLYVSTNDPAGACGAVVDSMVLTITPLPNTPPVVSPPAYCVGSTVGPLTATSGGGTMSWYSDAALTTFLSNANPFTPTGVTSTTSFWVTETVGSCVSPASMVTINFNPLPVADTSATATTNADCGQATGSITGVTVTSGASPFTYNWQDAFGATVATTPDLTGVGPGVYTLTITDANGCSTTVGGSSLFNVTSTSGVTASFTSDVATGERPLPVLFTNNSIGGVTYVWDFGTGDTTHQTSPGYTFTTEGVYTVCLIADNGAGCADTACATIDVFINSTFVIPNIFTPNDDNVNDIFTVKNVGLESLDAQIYDRWGLKMYEWHTTNGGWDGRTAAGVPAPDGQYFFIIQAKGIDGKDYFEKGAFTLIR